MQSPSGKRIVPNSGPDSAEMVWVVDSPGYTEAEKGELFAGRGGQVARAAAAGVGIDVASVKMLSLVPVRPSGDRFDAHDPRDFQWGLAQAEAAIAKLTKAKVFMLMGEQPLHHVGGFAAGHKIGDWRGSAMRVGELRQPHPQSKEEYLSLVHANPVQQLQDSQWLLPTFDPSDVANQYKWHAWLMNDFRRGLAIANNDLAVSDRPVRQWYFNDLGALQRLNKQLKCPREHSGVLAFDTESWPYYIVGLATEDQVHVFAWDEGFREVTQEIFASPFVIKVAHNLQHDLTFMYKKLGITVAQPWFDTMGGAHVLNNEMEKSLSPGISTRFTNWPFHKWMVDVDPLWYNGLDNVVAYDAYAPELQELIDRGLYNVAKHDHALLAPLLDMQWFGFKVDTKEQSAAAEELKTQRDAIGADVSALVAPIVDAKLCKFTKPKLFEVLRKCPHCGGGKVAAQHCWRCAGLSKKPEKKADYTNADVQLVPDSGFEPRYCPVGSHGFDCLPIKGTSVAKLKAALPVCSVCGGSGKVRKRLEFNPDSPDQVADVLYRGLGIRARRYKGNESVKVGLIEPLAGEYSLVAKLVEYARTNADYETVVRLGAGPDGRLHCVFDPFGTASGRVASKEGLVEVGTNAMNIPKKARRLVVPDEEMIFLYPDMKAVEGRAIAVLSKDPKLIEVFNDDGADLHTLVRDDIRRIGFADFSRAQAKRLDFAVPYGANAKQLAVELTDEAYRQGEGSKLNESQAQLIIDTLLNGWYQGVRRWQSEVAAQLLQTRRVKSPTGRERVWLEYIYDAKLKGLKREVAKEGWSFGPQDIGAWVLGDGMLRAWNSGDWNKHRGLIHVHDALLFQTAKANVDEAKEALTKLLRGEMFGMKFLVEMKTGANWYEAS